MKYPKINTLWKRDANNAIIEGEYSCPEFGNIQRWHITEKIDGTNIRIVFTRETSTLEFKGRTDDAEIPKILLSRLKDIFTERKILNQFPDAHTVILYGEGYGNKIQRAGKHYRDDRSFILFDARIDGWWLEQHNAADIAHKLCVDYVPYLGIASIEGAVQRLKEQQKSMISNTIIAEGIVARSHPLMLFRDGTPIMWKLKVKDYEKTKKVMFQ